MWENLKLYSRRDLARKAFQPYKNNVFVLPEYRCNPFESELENEKHKKNAKSNKRMEIELDRISMEIAGAKLVNGFFLHLTKDDEHCIAVAVHNGKEITSRACGKLDHLCSYMKTVRYEKLLVNKYCFFCMSNKLIECKS